MNTMNNAHSTKEKKEKKIEKEIILLKNARHAKTVWQRFKGLMGVSPNEFNYELVFHLPKKGRINASIHMLFMKMPIDVVFLDEQKKVVDLVENISPWTVNYTPAVPAQYLVELPKGSIAQKKITIGKQIQW